MIVFDALLLSLIHAFPNASLLLSGEAILSGLPDIFGGIILLVIGILIVAALIATAIVLLPAIIIGVLVWFLTGSFLFTGIAFLVVCVIWLAAISGR